MKYATYSLLMLITIMITMLDSYGSTDLSGIYAGASLNYSTGFNKREQDNLIRHDAIKGFEEGIHLKMQKDFGKYIINFEPGFAFSCLQSHAPAYKGKKHAEKLKKKYDYLMCFNIGVKLDNSVVYCKMGFNNSHFILKKKFYGVPLQNKHDKFKKSIKGLILGIGFETPIVDKIYGGAEMTYNFFENKNFKPNANTNISCKVRNAAFVAKINYKI